MEIKFNSKRGFTPTFSKPHITINYRGMIFFNAEYISKAKSKGFDIHIYENEIIIDHSVENPTYIIKKNKYSHIVYNRQLALFIEEKIGVNSIFPTIDLYGNFSIEIAKVKAIKTLKINNTEYSITGLKNYINTLKKRSLSSSKEESRTKNKSRYDYALGLAKKNFPEEFNNY